jgi:hypothetical protein
MYRSGDKVPVVLESKCAKCKATKHSVLYYDDDPNETDVEMLRGIDKMNEHQRRAIERNHRGHLKQLTITAYIGKDAEKLIDPLRAH